MNRRDAVLAGVMAASVAVPAGAHTRAAATADSGPTGPRTQVRAFLVNAGTGGIVGTFDIRRFAAIDDLLHTLGTASITDGPRTLVVTQALPIYFIASVAAPGTLNTTCPMLRMSTGAINLVQLGFFLTIQPVTIEIADAPTPASVLGRLPCEIAELLNGGSATPPILDRLVRLLNEVLDRL